MIIKDNTEPLMRHIPYPDNEIDSDLLDLADPKCMRRALESCNESDKFLDSILD